MCPCCVHSAFPPLAGFVSIPPRATAVRVTMPCVVCVAMPLGSSFREVRRHHRPTWELHAHGTGYADQVLDVVVGFEAAPGTVIGAVLCKDVNLI